MMLMDDAPLDILGSLAAEKAQLVKLYDTPLMLGGGRVAGWAVTEPEALEALEKAVENLAQPRSSEKNTPARPRRLLHWLWATETIRLPRRRHTGKS